MFKDLIVPVHKWKTALFPQNSLNNNKKRRRRRRRRLASTDGVGRQWCQPHRERTGNEWGLLRAWSSSPRSKWPVIINSWVRVGTAPPLRSERPKRPPTSLPSFSMVTHISCIFSEDREFLCASICETRFLIPPSPKVEPNSIPERKITATARGSTSWDPAWAQLTVSLWGSESIDLRGPKTFCFVLFKDCSIKRDVFDFPPWLQNDHLLLFHFQMIILPNYHWKVNGYFQNWSQMFTVFFWCPQEDHVSRDPLVLCNEKKDCYPE